MKWFGEPWPCDERRAPVCEDDADRTGVPIGMQCARCGRVFTRDDQGVMLPVIGRVRMRVDCYHVTCFLATVIGERMALEIAARW